MPIILIAIHDPRACGGYCEHDSYAIVTCIPVSGLGALEASDSTLCLGFFCTLLMLGEICPSQSGL